MESPRVLFIILSTAFTATVIICVLSVMYVMSQVWSWNSLTSCMFFFLQLISCRSFWLVVVLNGTVEKIMQSYIPQRLIELEISVFENSIQFLQIFYWVVNYCRQISSKSYFSCCIMKWRPWWFPLSYPRYWHTMPRSSFQWPRLNHGTSYCNSSQTPAWFKPDLFLVVQCWALWWKISFFTVQHCLTLKCAEYTSEWQQN